MTVQNGSIELADRPTYPRRRSNPLKMDDEENFTTQTDSFLSTEDKEQDLKPPNPGLSWLEMKNLALLFLLTFVHAIPMTFSWSTMPILLRQQVSYLVVGTFYISQYPYSIKVLWSPIVEAWQIRALGRRKSWLVPCFLINGVVIFWLAFNQDHIIERIARGEAGAMTLLVLSWLLLTWLCSVLRIAIDAWGLELLTQANVHWTGATISGAEITANVISFNLFLGLSVPNITPTNEPSSASSSSGTTQPATEEISTKFYFTCTAIAFFIIPFIILFKHEQPNISSTRTIYSSYKIILRILSLPQIWTLFLIHMTSMIGFLTNDSVTVLQLVKNNFTDRDIAALATAAFPFSLLAGWYVGRQFSTSHPLRIWRKMFLYRLVVAIISQCSIMLVFTYRDHHNLRWMIALFPYIISKTFEIAMFVALIAFHSQVADPQYGGIYMSLLSTTLNIRYDVLQFIYVKTIGLLDGSEGSIKNSTRLIDGYQIVNFLGVCIAIPVFWFFMRPATFYLQGLEVEKWRIGDVNVDDGGGGASGGVYQGIPLEERFEIDDVVDEEEENGLARSEGEGEGKGTRGGKDKSYGVEHRHNHSR